MNNVRAALHRDDDEAARLVFAQAAKYLGELADTSERWNEQGIRDRLWWWLWSRHRDKVNDERFGRVVTTVVNCLLHTDANL